MNRQLPSRPYSNKLGFQVFTDKLTDTLPIANTPLHAVPRTATTYLVYKEDLQFDGTLLTVKFSLLLANSQGLTVAGYLLQGDLSHYRLDEIFFNIICPVFRPVLGWNSPDLVQFSTGSFYGTLRSVKCFIKPVQTQS